MEDNMIFEFNSSGTAITNLYNYTMPLIRYQMSDQLVPISDITKTLPFTKVQEVVGRNENVPLFINDNGVEDFISPIILVELYVKHLKQFQFHLIDKKSLWVLECPVLEEFKLISRAAHRQRLQFRIAGI